MKTLYVLGTMLLLFSVSSAQTIAIPDYNFKQRLLQSNESNFIACGAAGNSLKLDSNNDGEIQFDEVQSVKKLNITWSQTAPIASLEGILSFTNLEDLDCHRDVITALDLTGMSNLKRLSCSDNHIAGNSLKLDGCVNLEYLNCSLNNLTELDLSDCHSLTELYCRNNNLVNLDVSHCSQLEKLHCNENPNLLTINMQNNNQENWLNLMLNPNLQHICADESEVSNLQIIVTNFAYNCSVDSACLFLRNDKFESETETFSIYPNPASSMLNVNSDRPIDTANIYNNVGQLILSVSHTNDIDVSRLAQGNYFLKVTSDTQTQTLQFLKK